MDLPSKHVMYLSRRIGARGAASESESAAASYVIQQLEKSGVDVDVDAFFSCKSEFTAIIILDILAVLAYLAFRFSYTGGMLIVLLVFFAFQLETYSWGVISQLLHHSSSSNVLGTVRPKGEVKQIVVISSNYDTARSSPLGRRPLARAYRALYILSFISIVMILLLTLFGQAASMVRLSRAFIFWVWVCFAPFAVFLLIMALLMTWGEARGFYTAGANDNASGVGVMLSIISAIAVNPLEHTTVIGVATARGFSGGRGMIALLKKRKRTLKDAFFINLDHVGRGEPRLITREGVMLGFRCSRKLMRPAMKVVTASKSLHVEKGKCRVKRSDAMVANARGFRAITIGGTVKGTYAGWRNADDVFERIERGSLDKAVRFVHLMLEEIDRSLIRPKKAAGRRRESAALPEDEESVSGASSEVDDRANGLDAE